MVVAILESFWLDVSVRCCFRWYTSILPVKFYIKEDNRKEGLTALLPGYNCGACGNPGCATMNCKVTCLLNHKLNSVNQVS